MDERSPHARRRARIRACGPQRLNRRLPWSHPRDRGEGPAEPRGRRNKRGYLDPGRHPRTPDDLRSVNFAPAYPPPSPGVGAIVYNMTKMLGSLLFLMGTFAVFESGCTTRSECTSWHIKIELLGAAYLEAGPLTGELMVDGKVFPFECSCKGPDGRAVIRFGGYTEVDLVNTRTVVLNVRTSDGMALATDAEISLSDLASFGQHDSYQVRCYREGQLP